MYNPPALTFPTDPAERQSFTACLLQKEIRAAALSFDHDGLNHQGGIDLLTRERGYAPRCLQSPADHVQQLIQRGMISGNYPVLTQTLRNCPQNLRCPLYTRQRGICQTLEEQVSHSRRPYYGLAHLNDGRFEAIALDFRHPIPADISWWAGGVPVVWERRVLRVEDFVCEAFDHCHVWELRTRGPRKNKTDLSHFRHLTAVFRQHLHASAEEAREALLQAASELRLQREENYLHNAVGVGPDRLVIVVAHGSLERIGEIARDAGATHAIVVDNGGSCEIALHRPFLSEAVSHPPIRVFADSPIR